MTKEQYLKDMVAKYGWKTFAIIDEDNVMYEDTEGITIRINLKTGDFNFEYLVPESQAELVLDKRNLFYEEVVFTKFYAQVRNIAKYLKESKLVKTAWQS